MDEFDKEWLEHINSARSKNSLKHIKESQFEILIDRIEKEWFDLTKNIPKPVKDDGLHEDIACAVCNDGDCENSNAIVFCDGCNLAVHQGCYGVPFIPEGQWLCRKCMISPDRPVSCQFCPYTSNDTFSSLTDEGYPKNLFNNFNFGAFKLTTESNWTHLLCALFIPELNVENPVFMEPISGTNRIVKGRWTLPCYICKVKTSSQVTSACIQCDVKSCSVSFHATCARLAGLCMRMKEKEGEDEVTMKAWCDKHTPKDFKDRLEVESTLREAQRIIMKKFYKHNDFNGTESTDNSSPLKIGKGRVETLTDSKIHDTIPIIAPKIIVDTLMEKHGNMFENDALLIIKDICKYWSLKRESRRGAPLLKRLHLEPWTTAPSLNKENDMIKQKQYETCLAFRNDLERARLLAELVRKREKEKIKRILLLSKMVEVVCCPILHYLKKAITELKKLDKTEMFQEPVTLAIAPDYFNIVKNPMDFQTMERKLEEFEYENAEDFNKDVRLIISNCTLYNAPDTSYFRNARLFEKQSQPILNFLESLATSANCTKTEDGSNVYTLSNCFDRNWFRIPSIEDFTEENLRPSTREVQFAQNEKLIRKKKSRIHVVNKFKDIVPENSPAILIDDEVVDQTQNHPQNSEPESLIIAPENTPEIKKRRTSNPFVDMAPLKQTQTLEKTTNRPVNQTKQAELDIQNVNFESKITTPTVVKKRGRPPKIRAEIPVIENLMKVKNFEIASAPEILEVSSSIRGRSKIGGRSRYIKSFENRIAELIPSENITEVSIPEKSKKKGFGVTDLDSNSLIFGVSDLGSNSFMKRLPQFSGKTIDDSGVNSSTDKSPTIGQNLQSSRFGSDLMEHSNDFFVPEKQNLDNSYATLSNGFDQNNSETSSESTENIEINRKRGKSQPPIYETEDSPQKKRKHRGNSVPVLSQSPISSPVEKLDITTKDSENSSKIDNQCELVVNNPRSTRHQKQSAIEVEDIVDSQKTPDGMMTPEPEISRSPKKKKNKQKDLKECASEVAKSDSSEISKNTMNSTKKTNNKNFVQSLETEDQRPIKNTPSKELSDLMKNTAPITQSRKRNRSIEPSLIPKSKNLRDEKDQKKSKDFQKTQTEQLMKEEKLMEFPKTSKISNPKVGRSRVLPELNVSSSEIHEKRKRTTTTLFPGI
ncbi:nuA3 HAT complex component nto1, partial [Nowakowskiella sp. JEL0078]